MKNKIILIAETLENRLLPSSYELISFSRKLLNFIDGEIMMIIPGEDVLGAAEKTALETGLDITVLENPHLKYPNLEVLSRGLQEIVPVKNAPLYICFIHSIRGMHIAADLSVKLNASCISSVEALSLENNNIMFRRSLFGGKLLMGTTPLKKQMVITVLPGAFSYDDEYKNPKGTSGNVKVHKFDYRPKEYISRGITKSQRDDKTIDEAEVIVSAGRGIGSADNLPKIKSLAEIFAKSAIGSSRAVCDMGWLPYTHQIGQTGKSVKPRLYIACGISGAQQHITGMRNSQMIVSINNDPGAPIFSYSHYGIVEDLNTFIPLLVEKYKETYN